jgi:uncharacterized SAM-binding protein YcdF (DUF218 family)
MNQRIGNQADADMASPGGASPARRRNPLRALGVAAGAAAIVGLVVGFVGFADSVTGSSPPADPRAEGIVVLTGGTARIDGALQLLAEGRAKRLLISGVNPAVTRNTLAGTVDTSSQQALACCVDLDYRARDTIGNASETRRWAGRQGFSSLIVVTSDYHMPRSMAELAEAMPGARLIAFPVHNPELQLTGWWHNAEAFGLLAREYGKYLLVEARRMLPSGQAARAATEPIGPK